MKHVLFYEAVDDFRPKAMENFPAHQERFLQFHERGVLLMIGPFTDGTGEAMAVFTSREAAEEFAADDPFVVNGVVAKWEIRAWGEALVPEDGQ